ncbi:hypothetical protein P152DRAFT_446151 [Eremomyces bilateralis CBS 781.70]|uniref:DUF7492 domain-containing protein n=1 Tax=Eremomyces bilateralis CBS 781.70 TaxID=1392243 RepID=A0A6G1GEM5_9PEZI|nr:uncharacterized protein P152DRAFT_446151 [Eremomyces bilateralis CBS 781.70]KAF1816503.1 hypothetical protein P152DRAFT_446151 [Eremomyces bilateralis CBS 781.70]
MHTKSTLTALFGTVSLASAHSWVEQAQVINNGVYVGDLGFARSWGMPMDDRKYQIPGAGANRPNLAPEDLLCGPNERASVQQGSNNPRLQASPGDFVALKYRENGHTTTNYEPLKVGTLFLYATENPKEDQKLMDALDWTKDGSLDEGRLLNEQPFDDGRCYEHNPGSTANAQRAGKFPNDNQGASWLWCESDIQVPTETATGQPLTVYWVWNFTAPNGAAEWYTSCLDFDIVDKPEVQRTANATPQPAQPLQDTNTKALANYIERAGGTEAPANTAAPSASSTPSTPSTSAAPPLQSSAPPASSPQAPSSSSSFRHSNSPASSRGPTGPMRYPGYTLIGRPTSFQTSYRPTGVPSASGTGSGDVAGPLTITVTEMETRRIGGGGSLASLIFLVIWVSH